MPTVNFFAVKINDIRVARALRKIGAVLPSLADEEIARLQDVINAEREARVEVRRYVAKHGGPIYDD